MPFIVKRTNSCPASKPFGVFTETSHGSGKSKGSPHGCFPTVNAAREQQKALYSNVPEAKSAAPPPPNLRDAEDSEECCNTCHMFDDGKCWGYGNYEVETTQVCNSYSPEPAAEEKSAGSEVPSMSATASPALTPRTNEWRRERSRALSESQRKRPETRQVHEPLELRKLTEDGTRTLRSYASLFNEPYTVRAAGYRFEETVKPGAFKRTLGTSPDVVFRYDHSGPPLARTSSGTLRLGEDSKGLWYEADLNPDDPDVKALVPKIERGDLSESSFAFRIGHNGDKWNDDHDKRDILACELDRGDVSVVTFGASRATSKHMLLRSEEAMRALQEIGFEKFMEAWMEWRDWSLLPSEERLGKVISSQSMETLRQVLGLIADADDAVDEAEAMLADFLGIPDPEDGIDNGGVSDGDVTSAEQLAKVGRSEERKTDSDLEGDHQRTTPHLVDTVLGDLAHAQQHMERLFDAEVLDSIDSTKFNAEHLKSHLDGAQEHAQKLDEHLSEFASDPSTFRSERERLMAQRAEEEGGERSEEARDDPTYEDYDVMYGLKNAKLALASVKACQLCDPDYESDPDDQAVMAQIEAAEAAIDKALVAQSKDGRQDADESNSEHKDLWQSVERLAREVGFEVRWLTNDDGSSGFEILGLVEDTYWLCSQDEIPEDQRADLSDSGRQAMANAGTAMKDGSYPIPNVTFLRKAIQAFGRAKDKPAVKAWIKRRAKALGATNLIPTSWRDESWARDIVKLCENDSEDLLVEFKLRRGA